MRKDFDEIISLCEKYELSLDFVFHTIKDLDNSGIKSVLRSFEFLASEDRFEFKLKHYLHKWDDMPALEADDSDFEPEDAV